MHTATYDESQARRLLCLLEAIGREIVERQALVRALADDPPWGEEPRACAAWAADLAHHRRELRAAHTELERLGCSLVGRRPLTFRIPRRTSRGARSFLWQGDALLPY